MRARAVLFFTLGAEGKRRERESPNPPVSGCKVHNSGGALKKAITPQGGGGAKIIMLSEMCFNFMRGALGGDGGVWDPTGSTIPHTNRPQFLKSGTPMTIGKV